MSTIIESQPEKPANPYELYTEHTGGAFIVFETTERTALPLFSLKKATLRSAGNNETLTCDFGDIQVFVEGSGMADVFEQMLNGRVKMIRRGVLKQCHVQKIQIIGA